MAKLIIYEESNHADVVFEAFELTDTRILIGADYHNQLILNLPEIDPTHASLELREDYWFLQDLGGPGGTGVNGKLIEGPRKLRHNDIIELGSIRMRFYQAERGVTAEIPLAEAPAVEPDDEEDIPEKEISLSGRVWFAALAGFSSLIILAMLALLGLAYWAGIFTMTDLFPGS